MLFRLATIIGYLTFGGGIHVYLMPVKNRGKKIFYFLIFTLCIKLCFKYKRYIKYFKFFFVLGITYYTACDSKLKNFLYEKIIFFTRAKKYHLFVVIACSFK